MNTTGTHQTSLISIGGRNLVSHEEIDYFEASGNYTLVYFTNSSRKIMVATTIGEIARRMAATNTFIRPNRKLLVNMKFVVKVNNTSGQLLLKNRTTVEIPRRRLQTLEKEMSLLMARL